MAYCSTDTDMSRSLPLAFLGVESPRTPKKESSLHELVEVVFDFFAGTVGVGNPQSRSERIPEARIVSAPCIKHGYQGGRCLTHDSSRTAACRS
jgi:hypothetical protein